MSTPSNTAHALERINVELAVHEQRAMELLAHGLHVGLFLDELAGALPMVAAFAVWGQRQQVRARIANSVEHTGIPGRQGWGTSFSARYTCRNIVVVIGR